MFQEYRIVCRETGRPVPYLQINLSENQLVYSSRAPGAPPLEANSKKEARRGRRSRKRDGQSCAVDRGEPGPNAPPIDEIERSIDDRNEARRSCNFSEADRIRDDLHKRGVALMDEPGGRGKGAEVLRCVTTSDILCSRTYRCSNFLLEIPLTFTRRLQLR